MVRRVLEELGPTDHPAGGGLNALCEGDGDAASSRQAFVELVVGAKPQAPLQLFDVGNAVSKIHVQRLAPKRGYATQKRIIPKMGIKSEPGGMEKWPQRERFSQALKAYQESTGKIHEEVAAALDITLPTLRNYLYGSKNPSVKVLQRAAGLFGCSVTEFLDDPGAVPAGMDPDKWAEASDRDRVLASAMLEDLKTIPEEEKEAYYQLWKQGVMIGRSRMMAEAKTKKASEGKGGKKP